MNPSPETSTSAEAPALENRPTATFISVNDHARAIYSEMLHDCGVDVSETLSSDEFRNPQRESQAAPIRPSLLVIDLGAAKQDEWQVVDQVQKQPVESRPPVIMLIPAGQVDAADRCRQLGITHVLIKPVKQAELQAAIRGALAVEAPSRRSEALQSDALAQRPLRILVADDSMVNQEVARGLLELCGHAVTLADDGVQAVEHFEAETFDLILMDIEMPELDGLAAARQIRKIESSQGSDRTPIVALSAHAFKGFFDECQEAGMDAYLAKPINPAELFSVTKSIGERQEQHS